MVTVPHPSLLLSFRLLSLKAHWPRKSASCRPAFPFILSLFDPSRLSRPSQRQPEWPSDSVTEKRGRKWRGQRGKTICPSGQGSRVNTWPLRNLRKEVWQEAKSNSKYTALLTHRQRAHGEKKQTGRYKSETASVLDTSGREWAPLLTAMAYGRFHWTAATFN